MKYDEAGQDQLTNEAEIDISTDTEAPYFSFEVILQYSRACLDPSPSCKSKKPWVDDCPESAALLHVAGRVTQDDESPIDCDH